MITSDEVFVDPLKRRGIKLRELKHFLIYSHPLLGIENIIQHWEEILTERPDFLWGVHRRNAPSL
jgi:hypothetical protein